MELLFGREQTFLFSMTVNWRSKSCGDTKERHESTRSHDMRCTRVLGTESDCVWNSMHIAGNGFWEDVHRTFGQRDWDGDAMAHRSDLFLCGFVTGSSPRYAAAWGGEMESRIVSCDWAHAFFSLANAIASGYGCRHSLRGCGISAMSIWATEI